MLAPVLVSLEKNKKTGHGRGNSFLPPCRRKLPIVSRDCRLLSRCVQPLLMRNVPSTAQKSLVPLE
jgi:hypothetical protein